MVNICLVNIVKRLTILISDLSTDFTVIALTLTTAHAQHEPFQLKLRRRRRRFVYLNGCSLWKAVQAHALLARSLADTVRAQREHNRLREAAAPKATPMALVHPLALSLSPSLRDCSCRKRVLRSVDADLWWSLPPSPPPHYSSLLCLSVCVFVCLCIALGQVFVLFCFNYRFSVVVCDRFFSLVCSLGPVMKALTKQLPGPVWRSNWLIFHYTRQCTAVKGFILRIW